MGPLLSVTTAPLNLLSGGSYVDLKSTLSVMKKLKDSSIVDGFELQDLAEWDARGPPRDIRKRDHRTTVWKQCEKYGLSELVPMLVDASVLSVHANRDIGICLCSEDEDTILHGRTLIEEALHIAEEIGARQVVFHLWDTYSTNFDPKYLRDELLSIAANYPSVISSIENVPTHLEGVTPFDLVRMFDHITLDTRWAGFYDELDEYSQILDKISNVHLRGALEDKNWHLDGAPFSFEEALHTIHNEWGYGGLFTLEPERSKTPPTLSGFKEAVRVLRNTLHHSTVDS